MDQTKYTQVTIRRTTLARLKAEIDRLIALEDRGSIELPDQERDPINPLTKKISIDALINRMLDAPAEHKRRADESRAKRRAAKKKGETT